MYFDNGQGFRHNVNQNVVATLLSQSQVQHTCWSNSNCATTCMFEICVHPISFWIWVAANSHHKHASRKDSSWRKCCIVSFKKHHFERPNFGLLSLHFVPDSSSQIYCFLGGLKKRSVNFKRPCVRCEHIPAGLEHIRVIVVLLL